MRCTGCRIEPLEGRILLSTVSWIGTTSASWNTTADWSSHALPQSGDDVVINQTGGIAVTLTGSASVRSISVTGDTLAVSGGTLSVAASSSIGPAATLTLSSATFALATGAALTNSGSITINPGSQLSGDAYTQTSTGTLTLASGTAGAGVGTNLLGDPGFETPAAGNSTTTPPTIWGQWGSSYVSKLFAHSGAQSLVESGANSGVNQSFSVTPGVSYSASVYGLTPTTAKLTGSQGAFLNIMFFDSSGNSISTGSKFITVLNSNSTAGVWTLATTTTTAPANAAKVTIALQVGPYTGISGTAGGSAYFDDAQFGPTAIIGDKVTAASVSNSGTISIGAGDTISDGGSFTQTSTGILTALLGGPAAGNFYGNLTAGGAAALGGTLKATLFNGYSPSINDSFTLLNYASESGAFSTYQLPSGSTYAFQSGLNPTYVGISALPLTLSTTVNAAAPITTATNNLIGVNLAYWDDQLTTSQTQQMVEAAGLSLFRFPGGSSSDDFHFNISNNYGDSAANTIPQFAQFITEVGGTGIVTVDYGSGSPQEAEAELAYLEGSTSDTTTIGTGIEWNDSAGAWQNVDWGTVSYWAGLRAATPLGTNDGLNFLRIGQAAPFSDIKYWEMGNELYGSWEIDHHGTAGPGGISTGSQHDPATYAKFAAAFASFDAGDPNLPVVSVGIDSGDPTGSSDNNWTKTVLADGFSDGFVPGFISDHSYMQGPGSESDSFLLNDTVSNAASILDWSTRYADYQTMLQQTVGASASGVKVMATEFNSNYGVEGKQMTSIVNGLFIADSIGSLLNSGYTGGLVWDLRNGWTTTGNNSPTLYGWRQGGDEGLIGASSLNSPPSTGPYIAYPNYFAEQLASKFVQSGGTDVSAVSNYGELTVYSILEPNGHLDLMVLNKNPDAGISEQFNLQGFNPSGQAQIWQYGESQDYAQSQSLTGAAALANFNTGLSISGNSFSYAFPAYSMTVIDLTPLPTFASQTGSTLTINLNNIAAIAVAMSGSNVTVTESGSQDSFSGITSILVNGSATNNVLNFNGPLSMPFTFTNDGTTTLNVNSGILNFAGASTFNLGALNITAGAGVALPSASGSESQLNLNTLSIGSGGSLDLNNNRLLINYGAGADPIAAIAGWLQSGYNGGLWNGTGIFSTAAAANSGSYGLGYADSADAGNPAQLATGQIEVMYTLLGDANLDGAVNGSDFAILSTNFNHAVSGWDQGDFNYDGAANGSDFALLSSNFNKGVNIAATAAAPPAPAVASTTSDSTAIVAATPIATQAVKHKSRHPDKFR